MQPTAGIEADNELNPVNSVDDGSVDKRQSPTEGGLRRLAQGLLVDSGAGVTIGDGSVEFADYPLEDSTKKGQRYAGPGKEIIVNRGQRHVRLRLGGAQGPRVKATIQDAAVRRPILSVGDSESAGNMLIFDQQESAILPKGAPEIAQIRALLKKVASRLTMVKERNTYKLDAWVEPADSKDGAAGFGR